MNPGTTWLSCGILERELQTLLDNGRISGRLVFLNSMLHMNPPELERLLEQALNEPGFETAPVVLVYGDCSAGMVDLTSRYRAVRVDAINCAQMLLGHSRYRELMHQEAFFMLPEWAERWRSVFERELGLNPDNARGLMQDNRRELVYLDTGLHPVPEPEMEACSKYTGLPWRIEKTGLEALLALLLDAEKKARAEQQP